MLKLENVRKNYNSFSLDCSLEIMPGRITGIIGQNGAGKSTIFKAILGLVCIGSGKISIFGKDIKDFSVKDRQMIGVVLSDSGFSGYLTVNDVADILENLYDTFDKNLFIERIRKYGLPQNQKIKEFSTGMKAKLKIIAAITHKAKLLLLDEPTAGLDVVVRNELIDMIRAFAEEDDERSILISSHISSDLETLCDDLYMIHDGRIILHEDADVLLSNYALLKMDQRQFEAIDKQYILMCRKESFGYSCLTDQKQFYMENYPQLAVERGTIDELITMMVRGKKI